MQYPSSNGRVRWSAPGRPGCPPAAIARTQCIRLFILLSVVLALCLSIMAQTPTAPTGSSTGQISGTVTDVNNDVVSGAIVVLQSPLFSDWQIFITKDNGYFKFQDVASGGPYHVIMTAKGFTDWTSPTIVLKPGEYKILAGSALQVRTVRTTVNVGYDSEEVATQQVETALKQRILGIFPNFYVVYDPHPAPLTAKLKFKLAFRVIIDPVSIAGTGIYSGIQHASDTPDFQQGAKGYFQRFGANTADNVTGIMIGGAILPSLLHQDPRYFYKGKGTKRSRTLHALMWAFACKGDNGKWQPNYSSIGGDLAGAAISTTYYPESNRGVGAVFANVAMGAAQREVSNLFQEFILPKFTHRPK